MRFLVESGADINIANNYNNTCLMIASFKGHADVVRFLLSRGADPDAPARCGATALHFSADWGHLEVVRALREAGATLTCNASGLTPLMTSAERCQDEVVEFISERWGDRLSREERVTAMELLGASFANDKDNCDRDKAVTFLTKAMKERWREPANPLRKQVLPPVEAYAFCKESGKLSWQLTAPFRPIRIGFETHIKIRLKVSACGFEGDFFHWSYWSNLR